MVLEGMLLFMTKRKEMEKARNSKVSYEQSRHKLPPLSDTGFSSCGTTKFYDVKPRPIDC